MRSRGEWILVIAILGGGGVVFAAMFGIGFWQGWKEARDRQPGVNQAVLDAERAADRAEAVAAFADPTPPTPAESAEFDAFFKRLGSALDRGDESAVSALFDPDRMVDELDRVGAFDKIADRRQRGFRQGATEGVQKVLGPALVSNELLRWARTEVRNLRWAPDRSEVVIIAVHHDAAIEPAKMKMRWWLVSNGRGWRIYDFEDLDMGLRFSFMMRMIMTPELVREFGDNPGRLQGAMARVREAAAELFLRHDVEAAERALAPVRGMNLPAPAAAFREMVEGCLLLERGEPEAALARFDTCNRILPGMPVVRLGRANALNQLARFDEALVEARGYMSELGPDSLAYLQEGCALEGLGRSPEAADSFRKSLDETPDEILSLHGLRRVLPADDKGEVGERLARSGKASEFYGELRSEALIEEDRAGAKALTQGLRKAVPDDSRVVPDEIRDLVGDREFAEARNRVHQQLAGVKPEDPSPALSAYLYAMLSVDRPGEAYSAIPARHAARAFRILAEDLEMRMLDAEMDDKDPAEGWLRQLIGAHRRRDPADPWLSFFEGAIHQATGKHEEAAKAFAEGATALKKQPTPGADKESQGFDAEEFRSRRVECLAELKRELEAYAEVGPPDKTFRQLAYRYDSNGDEEGLADLVDAHEKQFPKDAAILYWRAEVDYLKGAYAAAAPRFARYREAAGDRHPHEFPAIDRQIRSLVRAGDAKRARGVLDGLPDDRVPMVLRAVVAAAEGNVVEVERLIAEQQKLSPGALWFYYDDDFSRLIQGEAFAELRKKYPDPRPKNATGPVG